MSSTGCSLEGGHTQLVVEGIIVLLLGGLLQGQDVFLTLGFATHIGVLLPMLTIMLSRTCNAT